MISRRGLLMATGLAAAVTGCQSKEKLSPARLRYGEDDSQVAELFLPPGGGRPAVAVVIHGGFWMSDYGMSLATPLAEDLARHGVAGYAIEYRRVGNGGGWPATFEDVAAAIDLLADRQDVDSSRVVAVGHSAGGHLAVWAAGRRASRAGTPGAQPRVVLRGAVSQAGVLDLTTAATQRVGGDAVEAFLGAGPDQDPDRYKLASPIQRLPVGVPVSLLHGTDDSVVPIDQSRRYHAAATDAGDDVRFRELQGSGHFDFIDTDHAAWRECRSEVQRLLS